jgi:hypothetical protein
MFVVLRTTNNKQDNMNSCTEKTDEVIDYELLARMAKAHGPPHTD